MWHRNLCNTKIRTVNQVGDEDGEVCFAMFRHWIVIDLSEFQIQGFVFRVPCSVFRRVVFLIHPEQYSAIIASLPITMNSRYWVIKLLVIVAHSLNTEHEIRNPEPRTLNSKRVNSE